MPSMGFREWSGQWMEATSIFLSPRKMVGYISTERVAIQSTYRYVQPISIPSIVIFCLIDQVVCDCKLRIRNIVARWPGSTHDSYILENSLLKTAFEGGQYSGLLLGKQNLFKTMQDRLYSVHSSHFRRQWLWAEELADGADPSAHHSCRAPVQPRSQALSTDGWACDRPLEETFSVSL